MTLITSLQNPTIKLMRALTEKKFRQDTGLFLAEGWDFLNRARKTGWVPEHLLSTEAISPWGSTQPMLVSDKIMAALSGQSNALSVVAAFRQRYATEVSSKGVWVALEDMRDPGNLGTIIRTADAVLQVRRVLAYGGVPTILEDIWLPGGPFKGLTAERLSEYHGPMYALFETEFGVHMVRAVEKIRAVLPEKEQCLLLNVEQSTPLLSVERIAFTYNDTPMEMRRALYLTSDHYYRNELN